MGYDASESAVRALHALAPLARALGLGVRVVSVHEDPARAEAWALEAEAYLRDHGVEASALVLGGTRPITFSASRAPGTSWPWGRLCGGSSSAAPPSG